MKTNIIVLLDRSGSMSSIKSDMEGGFKEFIEEQKKQPGEADVSLYQFDSEYEIVFEAKPVQEVNDLNLVPRGSTALIDSVVKTIDRANDVENICSKCKADKILVVVLTDGHENSSREHSKETMIKKIKHMQEKHDWQFAFLGADLNGFADAHSWGVFKKDQMANWENTSKGTQVMFSNLSHSVNNYRGADMGTDFKYEEKK